MDPKTIVEVAKIAKNVYNVSQSEGLDQLTSMVNVTSKIGDVTSKTFNNLDGFSNSDNKPESTKKDISFSEKKPDELPSKESDTSHKPIFVEQFPEKKGEDVHNLASTEYKDPTFVEDFPSSMDNENIKKTQNINDNIENPNTLRTIKTIRDDLAGQNHPETGVPYVKKEVITDTGERVSGVFPQFESKYDVLLSENLYQASDRKQISYCNKKLQEEVKNNPKLEYTFTKDQLAQIEKNRTPYGYTWHHSEDLGNMKLVDFDIHAKTRHDGGKKIWGGGNENR